METVNWHDPCALATQVMEELMDTCHEEFCLFAQYLISMVTLLHVHLATVDVILQT